MTKININNTRAFLACLLFIWSIGAHAYSSSPNTDKPKLDFFHTFSGNLATELTLAKKNKQFGLVLFFGTQHCRFCHRMKTTVFNQPSVQTYFKSNFRLLEIDIESTQSLINEQHQKVSYIEFAKLHRVRLTPTIAFLNQQGDLVYRQVGMIADPQEFIWLGEYVMSGQARKQSFSNFKMAKRRQLTQ